MDTIFPSFSVFPFISSLHFFVNLERFVSSARNNERLNVALTYSFSVHHKFLFLPFIFPTVSVYLCLILQEHSGYSRNVIALLNSFVFLNTYRPSALQI